MAGCTGTPPDLRPDVSPDRWSTPNQLTVSYGKNAALKDVTAVFPERRGRPARPQRRRQEHAAQVAAGLPGARKGLDEGARPRRGDLAARDSRAHRLHAGKRLAHPRHERGVVRRLLRPALGPAGGRRDAARARGALLRRPRRSALSQHRNLFDRHEAAHQAGAGDRPRPRPAVSRRADQRHGPEGPRRDARADPRSRAPQERQPDPVVAPAARRRIHLRPRGGDGQGHGRDLRADRGAQGHAPAASTSCASRATSSTSSKC